MRSSHSAAASCARARSGESGRASRRRMFSTNWCRGARTPCAVFFSRANSFTRVVARASHQRSTSGGISSLPRARPRSQMASRVSRRIHGASPTPATRPARRSASRVRTTSRLPSAWMRTSSPPAWRARARRKLAGVCRPEIVTARASGRRSTWCMRTSTLARSSSSQRPMRFVPATSSRGRVQAIRSASNTAADPPPGRASAWRRSPGASPASSQCGSASPS